MGAGFVVMGLDGCVVVLSTFRMREGRARETDEPALTSCGLGWVEFRLGVCEGGSGVSLTGSETAFGAAFGAAFSAAFGAACGFDVSVVSDPHATAITNKSAVTIGSRVLGLSNLCLDM